MIVCDTSVLIAAFARWHDAHLLATAALTRTDALIDHVAVETFSVLTRLPPPRRAPPGLVAEFVEHHYPAGTPRFATAGSEVVLRTARDNGIAGGAVYDLVVAMSAAAADATLISLDRRAAATYEAAGSPFQLLG